MAGETPEMQAMVGVIGQLDGIASILPSAGTSVSFLQMNGDLYIAGQIEETTFEQIQAHGVKSVFNLRDPTEDGNVDLTSRLKDLGVELIIHPVAWDGRTWTDEEIDVLLAALDRCPKPALVYCKYGCRSAMIGIAHTATRTRYNDGKMRSEDDSHAALEKYSTLLEEVCGKVDPRSMKQFVQAYISRKIANMLSRPGISNLKDDIFIAGQLTEDEINGLVGQGIKAVINLRPISEAGQFGVGVLAREDELVKGAGMEYVNVPVPKGSRFDDPELLATVSKHLQTMPRPILVHCRSGGRAKAVVNNAEAAKQAESSE
eukprot:CAMPEP_0181332386 /NCGR_PEP_ID=MMETSP1101-20121128/25067_1 /TAXON_ID=46948 /ORGANISM="Rhodomonas abbreviata, Strain Caron Lab Isolate" /LENGTH=316 /DNA_ID=CAMNT_0023442029 /DNA_START=38 /DNA_END=988 /DNA_ORIENTATION=+